MFTGLVEELGEVADVGLLADAAHITIEGPVTTAGAAAGSSIAVNGVCLTITGISGSTFTADVMAETLRRTSLGALVPGSRVNLERPLPVGGRLGGHLVQGHVDAVATVISRTSSDHWDLVRFTIPPGLAPYLVEKGSVAVDGVSLTVAALGNGADAEPPWFEVSLIPTTLAATTLGTVSPGSLVNTEADMIAKYVERLLTTRGVRS